MKNCLNCNGELEYTAIYARCKECGSLFIKVAGTWLEYPVLAPMRPMVEKTMGFSRTDSTSESPKKD
jgi:hypothetical protein